MKAKQIYKIRLDLVDENGKARRIWNPGKYSRIYRAYAWIERTKDRIEEKGGTVIASEIWDIEKNACIEAKQYLTFEKLSGIIKVPR